MERKSKFLARIKPVQNEGEAEDFIEKIRKSHWDATHNVPAYIVGIKTRLQKYSDDNEPGGTAGLPVLEVLKAYRVVNAALVVTRYFGGTLLGRGGLIRAYGGAAKGVLLKAGLVRMVPALEVALTVDYVHAGKVQNEILNQDVALVETSYLERVTFSLQVPSQGKKRLRRAVQELTANEFDWEEGVPVYQALPVKEK